MLKAKDPKKHSLLAFAVQSGDKGTFKVIREYLEQILTTNEVRQRFKRFSQVFNGELEMHIKCTRNGQRANDIVAVCLQLGRSP